MIQHLLLITLAFGEESPLKADERVVLFPALGRLEEGGRVWRIAVHGWLFEPEEDSEVRAGLLAVLRASCGILPDEAEGAVFRERAKAFLVDNERGKSLSVRLGGKVRVMDETLPNGHFTGTCELDAAEARRLMAAEGHVPRKLEVSVVTREGDRRVFAGEVHLLPPVGVSVISDIDDTIKVSEVLDRKALLANTFLRDFRPVPDMAEVYTSWRKKGAAFHYVSASPWQLYEPLEAFRTAAGFPPGTFHLKTFRWKDSTFFDLLQSPIEYKRGEIDPLLSAFPRRRFILVGDTGEKDPEVYGETARKHPSQVEKVFLRDVTGEGKGSERLSRAFEGVPRARWRVFTDPSEIAGLLPEPPAPPADGPKHR